MSEQEINRKSDMCLVGVAIGERYEIMGRGMIDSFCKYNDGWDVKFWAGSEIDKIIPRQFLSAIPFNKSEIGRWCAVRDAIAKGYKHVLYCDNDIRFYGKHEFTADHSLVLFPHVVTEEAKRIRKHWLVYDGIPNLGMIEANVTDADKTRFYKQADEICTFIIDEVDHRPKAFTHITIGKLWLQNFASYLPYCGYDVAYNDDPAHNVAHWNLGSGDRAVEVECGRYLVVCNGQKTPIKTFHFSNAGIRKLERYGATVTEMKQEYLAALKADGLNY